MDFTDAHDRLATQMRDARRSERNDTVIQFDEPLTEVETKYLVDLHDSVLGYWVYHDEQFMSFRPLISSLQAKGMLCRGRYMNGVLWDGERPILNLRKITRASLFVLLIVVDRRLGKSKILRRGRKMNRRELVLGAVYSLVGFLPAWAINYQKDEDENINQWYSSVKSNSNSS